jgi:hypothetical protein
MRRCRNMTRVRLICVVAAMACAPTVFADEPKGSAKPTAMPPEIVNKPGRRVYVLHSGLHTLLSDPAKNLAAESLKDGLCKRGVCEDDLVVLENPFPNASWKSALPIDSLSMFFDAIDPASKISQDAYLRMHKALQAQGVSAKDTLIWVGHSAGGQMGLSMANLAYNLAKYPELAKQASTYQFDMVITLGAPVGSTYLPPEVKLRTYYSAEDKVMRWASKVGPWIAYPFGVRARINKIPAVIGENVLIRCFREVEHPSWDVDARVLDRIVAETRPDFRPPWHAQLSAARWGLSLSELMSEALEAEFHISLEDPPKGK